jgi:hypothetical protein
MRSGNSIMPQRVVVVFSNSHDTNFPSWHFFTCHNALWLFKTSHNALWLFRYCHNAFWSFFPLIERFPCLSVTYIYIYRKQKGTCTHSMCEPEVSRLGQYNNFRLTLVTGCYCPSVVIHWAKLKAPVEFPSCDAL